MSAHIPVRALGRYAAGDQGIAPDVLWAMETHLEQCADCRARLADASDGDTMALLAAVWVKVDAALSAAEPATVRRRWMPARSVRWVTPVLVPWLVTTVLVVLVALGFDLAVAGRGVAPPSLVVLLAPVARCSGSPPPGPGGSIRPTNWSSRPPGPASGWCCDEPWSCSWW